MIQNTVRDVRLVNNPIFIDSPGQGVLRVFEFSAVPFEVKRVFTVGADAGGFRGQHAHKRCIQLLTCVTGGVSVVCDDSQEKVTFHLNSTSDSLLIPPGIWSNQSYNSANSSLVVLCDCPYDEDDYIRDFQVFSKWRMSQ